MEVKREEFNGVRYVVAWINLTNDHLAVLHSDLGGKPLKTFKALKEYLGRQGKGLAFAMNAGMYLGDFSPQGLCICDGAEKAPLNQASGQANLWNFYWKPNGVFYLDNAGAHVSKTEDYAVSGAKPTQATQSGPMLLWSGTMHPGFKPSSTSRRIRNAVGVQNPHRLALVISESGVTFHELVALFRDRLGCADALYLDGEISSIYAPAFGRVDRQFALGPMLAVVVNQGAGE